MATTTKADPLTKKVGESINYGIDFDDLLNTSETISSATVVVDVGDNGLSITGVAVVTSDTVIKGVTLKANRGVRVRVASGNAGIYYELRASVVTSDSNTRQIDLPLTVEP